MSLCGIGENWNDYTGGVLVRRRVGLLVPDVQLASSAQRQFRIGLGNNWSSSQRRLHLFEHVGVHVRFLVVATVPEVALDMSGCLQHSWFDSGYMFVPVPVQFRRNSKGAVLGPGCRARLCNDMNLDILELQAAASTRQQAEFPPC